MVRGSAKPADDCADADGKAVLNPLFAEFAAVGNAPNVGLVPYPVRFASIAVEPPPVLNGFGGFVAKGLVSDWGSLGRGGPTKLDHPLVVRALGGTSSVDGPPEKLGEFGLADTWLAIWAARIRTWSSESCVPN